MMDSSSSLFVDPFRRFFSSSPKVHRSSPGLMDWIENPNAHIFKINVPGYKKEEVKVQIEDVKVLIIKAEFGGKSESTSVGSVWHVAERGNGDFIREIDLPENVKVDCIKAQLQNGLLTINVPKEVAPNKHSSPNVCTINISSKL